MTTPRRLRMCRPTAGVSTCPRLPGSSPPPGKNLARVPAEHPVFGTTLANWPGIATTAKLYAFEHKPLPVRRRDPGQPAEFAKQVLIEQLFGDLGARTVPAFSYIVPDQCRDMHGIGNTLAPCGGVNDTDDNDVSRGDDETFWLVNGITGSPVWRQGRNAIFVVF